MTNTREHKVMKKCMDEGWKPVRGGAPDWLFVKIENKKIVDVMFKEVKSPIDRLTTEQHIWKKVLQEYFHAHYSVEIVD